MTHPGFLLLLWQLLVLTHCGLYEQLETEYTTWYRALCRLFSTFLACDLWQWGLNIWKYRRFHKNRGKMRDMSSKTCNRVGTCQPSFFFFCISATYSSHTTNLGILPMLPNYNHKHSTFTTTLWDNMTCWRLKTLARNCFPSLYEALLTGAFSGVKN